MMFSMPVVRRALVDEGRLELAVQAAGSRADTRSLAKTVCVGGAASEGASPSVSASLSVTFQNPSSRAGPLRVIAEHSKVDDRPTAQL
jgi:hypothetical protein